MQRNAWIRSWTFLLVLSGAFLTNVPPIHGQTPNAAREEAKRWLEEFTTNFNRRDSKGAVALYTRDADQRVSQGDFLRGQAEIEKYLADFFVRNPEAKQQLSLTSARFADPNLLVAEATWEITGLSEGPSAKGLATYFLRKEAGKWLCIAGRSMIPAPSRQSPK